MPPKFKDLKRYCDHNGWVLVRDTDHWYYEKVLANGDVLSTKVSHAVHKAKLASGGVSNPTRCLVEQIQELSAPYPTACGSGGIRGGWLSDKEIPKALWQRILRKQLRITEQEFWQQL